MNKITKQLLLCLFITCALHTAHSQLGLRAGINTTSISINDGNLNTGERTGLHLGFTYGFDLSENIKLRPGVIYSIKGFELADMGESAELSYIEVPFSFLFDLLAGLHFELGPYLGAMVDNNQPFDIQYKNVDVGMNIGVGFKISRLGVGLTYGYGMSNIVDGNFGQGDRIRNRNISVYGYVYF